MAKLDWNALQWIAYYYIAFEIFTDREYSNSEKEMIGAKLLRFTSKNSFLGGGGRLNVKWL